MGQTGWDRIAGCSPGKAVDQEMRTWFVGQSWMWSVGRDEGGPGLTWTTW